MVCDMTGALLAWQSDNAFVYDIGHSLGAFLTSAGFAGTMALIAALVAANQVRKTREQDRSTRESDRIHEQKVRQEDLDEARKTRAEDIADATKLRLEDQRAAQRRLEEERKEERRRRAEDFNEIRRARYEDLAESRRVREEDLAEQRRIHQESLAAERERYQVASLWTRFAWVAENSDSGMLTPEQGATMLASIRVGADGLDNQLTQMIRIFREDQIDDLGIWEDSP